MTPRSARRAVVVATLLVASLCPRVARGQEIVNRRDESRRAFLTTAAGLYGHYCAHCHGDAGEGAGRLWAMELSPEPPNLGATRLGEEELVAFIRDGSARAERSALCPPWGRTISPAGVERLARHILSLAGRGSTPEIQPSTTAEPSGGRFPWLLIIVLVVEAVLLWRMLRRGRTLAGQLHQ